MPRGIYIRTWRHTEESKRKLSLAMCGRPQPQLRTESASLNRSMSNTGQKRSIETKQKLSVAAIGRPMTSETRLRMSLVNTGRIDSAETRKKKSESMKRRWKNPEYAHMVRSSCQQHPNSLESSILSLLSDLYPNQWKFVGDGSLNIDGLSPDIVHVSRKLLIECNGTYWHQEDESERLSRLESYGYKVLILWDKESRDQWVKKIGDFIL